MCVCVCGGGGGSGMEAGRGMDFSTKHSVEIFGGVGSE